MILQVSEFEVCASNGAHTRKMDDDSPNYYAHEATIRKPNFLKEGLLPCHSLEVCLGKVRL